MYLFGNSGLGYFNISVYLGKMQLLILEMQDNLQKTSFTSLFESVKKSTPRP